MKYQKYVLLDWPKYQMHMDQDYWSECHVTEVDGKSAAFIPEKYV